MREQLQTQPTVPPAHRLYRRAARHIRGEQRQAIRAIIERLYDAYNRNPSEQSTAKPIKRLEFFLSFTGADNVYDIQNKFRITDYVELSDDELIEDPRYQHKRGEECAACGTHIRNFYVVKREGVEPEIHHIGYDCMERMQADFAVDMGGIRFTEQATPRKREQRAYELEQLVSDAADEDVFSQAAWLAASAEDHDAHDPTIGLKLLQDRGSYKDWLWKQPLNDDIAHLLVEASNCHMHFPRHKQKKLWAYLAENRLLSVALYKGVLEDVVLLAKEQNIKLDTQARTLITSAKSKKPRHATLNDVGRILDALPFDVHKERKARNQAALNAYDGFVLAQALDDILPVFEMDKGHWHDAYVTHQYLFSKALTPKDYALIRKVAKRWLSGMSRSPEGYNRTKLYHLATRIEPITRFDETLEKLAGIQRKIQYARDKLTSDEYQRLNQFATDLQTIAGNKNKIAKLQAHIAEVLAEPKKTLKQQVTPVERIDGLTEALTRIERSYAEDDKTWTKYDQHLPLIKEHAHAKFLTQDDQKHIARLDKRLQAFVSIDGLNDAPIKRWRNYLTSLRALQQAVNDPLVVTMDFIKDPQRFAYADCVNKEFLKKLSQPAGKTKTMIITKASQEYANIRYGLQELNATREDILRWKQDIDDFTKQPHTFLMPEHQHMHVVPQRISSDNAIEGTALRYINPRTIKNLKNTIAGCIRLKNLAQDTEFCAKLETVINDYKPEYMRYYDGKRPATPVLDANAMRVLITLTDRDNQPVYVHQQLRANVEKVHEDLPYYRAAYTRRTALSKTEHWKAISGRKEHYLDQFYARIKDDAVLCRLINGITSGKEGNYRLEKLSRGGIERFFKTKSRFTGWSDIALETIMKGENERVSESYASEWKRSLATHAPAGARNEHMTRNQYAHLFTPALEKLSRIADETLLAVSEQHAH